MGEEDTRRTRHSQQIGIGSQCVFLYRVLSGIGTLLGVVVLDKGYSPLFVSTAIIVAADQWPVTIVLLSQFAPVIVVDGITYCITELEVEGCASLASTLNPVLDSVGAVPALTDRELRL